MNRGRRVLLVSWFADERAMYEEYWRYARFDPVPACVEASEAFETAVALKPDAIVTDIGFPKRIEDCLDLIRRLRNDSRTKGIALVVVSSFPIPQHRTQVEQAGADVFLPKPCLPQTLVEAIEHELHAA
jgi:CheY-like chemotaxis protein